MCLPYGHAHSVVEGVDEADPIARSEAAVSRGTRGVGETWVS